MVSYVQRVVVAHILVLRFHLIQGPGYSNMLFGIRSRPKRAGMFALEIPNLADPCWMIVTRLELGGWSPTTCSIVLSRLTLSLW